MKRICLAGFAAGIFALTALAAPRDLMSDTWVATDGLGRMMPSADTLALRTDRQRTVGIFYITWHGEELYDSPKDYRNVTEILESDSNARLTDQTGLWPQSNRMGSWHWGEPEMGYFLSCDEWVMRKDISMLADAGVDVLILDVTNAVCYWDQWDVLFATMEDMKAKGNPVPKICFWAFNGAPVKCVHAIYEKYYKPELYKDLWFYWDGKPLILCNMNPGFDAGGPNAAGSETFYSDEVRNFFCMRNMWWGYNQWAGQPYAGTEDNWCFGYEMNDPAVAGRKPADRAATHRGRMEEMAVTAGQHPISITGKSWRPGTGQPPLNEYDVVESAYVPWLGKSVSHPEAYGIYFQDRWDEALSVDPDFIYLNDWNEWTAGKFRVGRSPEGNVDGPASFLGRDNNTFYFVDQYNAEFNRTIQPAKGVCSDNYYMQMAQNIRRYKGARAVPEQSGLSKIKIDGNFDDWKNVVSYYFDTRGDVAHRNYNGYAGHHYTNTSGRNDIVESKVAVGKKDVSFYVCTDSAITASTDPNWMLLLIDADSNSSTGWHGYDFIVNKKVTDNCHTTLMRYDEVAGQWVEIAQLPYAVSGNELELRIPRDVLGLPGNEISFDFKWADNPQSLDTPVSLCLDGDTAPNRRFNYRYIWKRK